MPKYRKPEGAVPLVATKWDKCTVLKHKERAYRFQKGSGRSDVFALIKGGMSVGALCAAAAKIGYDSKFVVGSLLKYSKAAEPAFIMKAPEGTSIAEIKSIRDMDPERAKAMLEKREAKKAEVEARKAERAKIKADRDAERKAKADERAKAKTTRDADKAKAAEVKKAAAEKKKAEAEAAKAKAKKAQG